MKIKGFIIVIIGFFAIYSIKHWYSDTPKKIENTEVSLQLETKVKPKEKVEEIQKTSIKLDESLHSIQQDNEKKVQQEEGEIALALEINDLKNTRQSADSLEADVVSAKAISKQLFSEERDYSWANEHESKLSAILFTPEFSGQYPVSDLECKSSSCRLNLQVNSTADIRMGIATFVEGILSEPMFSGFQIATNNDIHTGIVSIYLVDKQRLVKTN